MLELNPNAAAAYFERGKVYASQHAMPQANDDFTQAIRLAPRDAQAYLDRGLVHILQMQDVDAKQDFDTCLRLNPKLKPEVDAPLGSGKSAIGQANVGRRRRAAGRFSKAGSDKSVVPFEPQRSSFTLAQG